MRVIQLVGYANSANLGTTSSLGFCACVPGMFWDRAGRSAIGTSDHIMSVTRTHAFSYAADMSCSCLVCSSLITCAWFAYPLPPALQTMPLSDELTAILAKAGTPPAFAEWLESQKCHEREDLALMAPSEDKVFM